MENVTSSSNITSREKYRKEWEEVKKHLIALMTLESVFMLAGTFLNLWLICCILKCPKLRIKLRNQLICNVAFVHLLWSCVQIPGIIIMTSSFMVRVFRHLAQICALLSFLFHFGYIIDFVCDWLMVAVAAIYLAHVLEFNAETKLSPRSSLICKFMIHLCPWVMALLLTPSSIEAAKEDHPCLIVAYENMYIFEIVYTVFPLCLASVIIVAAFVFRQRRFTLGTRTSSGNMGVTLLGSGREIDNVYAYIAAIGVCFLCAILQLLPLFNSDLAYQSHTHAVAATLLSNSRPILLFPVWLLLPDIRERIRSWRPWKSTTPPGIDLTVEYNKES